MAPPAWTTPKTWVTDELVTAAMLNTHLRDNLNALKTPPTYSFDGPLTLSTTSTNWVDMHSSLTCTLVTTGGDLLVGAWGRVAHNTLGATIWFQVERNGYSQAEVEYNNPDYDWRTPVTIAYLNSPVPAGTHTLKLRWRTSAGTLSTNAYNWTFFVKEL